jgi:hypothetical protein
VGEGGSGQAGFWVKRGCTIAGLWADEGGVTSPDARPALLQLAVVDLALLIAGTCGPIQAGQPSLATEVEPMAMTSVAMLTSRDSVCRMM